MIYKIYDYVIQDNIPEIRKLLVKGDDINGDCDRESTIIRAISMRNIKMVKYLFVHGADINMLNDCHCNALMWACRFGKLNIVKYLILL